MGLVFSISNFFLIKFIRQIIGVSFSCSNSALVENFLKIKVLIQKRFHLNVLEAMDLWGSLALPGPIRCLNCFWPFTYFSRDQYQNQSSTLGNENLMKEIKYRIQLAKGQSFSDLYPDLNRWKMGSIKIWNGRGFSRTNASNFYTLTNDPPDKQD